MSRPIKQQKLSAYFVQSTSAANTGGDNENDDTGTEQEQHDEECASAAAAGSVATSSRSAATSSRTPRTFRKFNQGWLKPTTAGAGEHFLYDNTTRVVTCT